MGSHITNPFATPQFNPYINMDPSARVPVSGSGGGTTYAGDMAQLWASGGGNSDQVLQNWYSGGYENTFTPGAPTPAPIAASTPSISGGNNNSGNLNLQSAIQARPQTEAQTRAAQLAKATTAQTAARGYGLDKLNKDFNYFGFNPADYSTQIDRYLNNIGETIDPYDANAKQYYTGNLFGELKGNIESQDVTKYQNQLDQFLGAGWENNFVNNSLGEGTLNNILSQQYNTASDTIDRAAKRGTLTDTGKQYSLGQLGQQRSAGYSVMDNLRDGIVSGYRNDLVTQGNNAYDKLNTYSLGDSFDSQAIKGDINNFYNNQKAGFEGNFRSDFGNQQLFDVNSLIQKGGVNQGVTNQSKNAPDVLGALNLRKNDEESRRGIGSQGVF